MIRQIALMGALCVGSGVVVAQPNTVPVAPLAKQVAPQMEVEVVTPKGDQLRFNIRLRDANAIKTLTLIAARGNLQMVVMVKNETHLVSLVLSNLSPQDALRAVCEQAGLSPELRDGIWFISPVQERLTLPKNDRIIDEMAFADVDALQLLNLISTQFDVPIVVGAKVKGRISYIRLSHKTACETLELLALVIDATIRQEKDGTFIVDSKPATTAKVPVVPTPDTAAKAEAEKELRSRFILIAPQK